MMTKTDPSAVVVPFGKHKGATVAELLTKDPQYAEWVIAQGWVAERFAELHAAIATRGAASDDSPEHNAIQVRFLDETFRVSALLALRRPRLFSQAVAKRKDLAWREYESVYAIKRKLELSSYHTAKEIQAELASQLEAAEAALEAVLLRPVHLFTEVAFEIRGIDVIVGWDFSQDQTTTRRGAENECKIEIKPTMGDDFPSVMRQMGRLGSRNLVLGSFSGASVSEPDMRRMFQANGIEVASVRDIDAEMANAREIISAGILARAAGDV
jgi:hypothetical protein